MDENLHIEYNDVIFQDENVQQMMISNIMRDPNVTAVLQIIFNNTHIETIQAMKRNTGIFKKELMKCANLKREPLNNCLSFLEGATLVYSTRKSRELIYQCTSRGIILALDVEEAQDERSSASGTN